MQKIALSFFIVLMVVFHVEGENQEPTAQEEADIIVVTGTKFEQNIEDSVEDIEVITAEEMEQSGAKNLSEAVENISGIIVTGHPTDTIMLQGFDGDYVKILIDGVEVTGDIGGSVAVSQISTADIERIEIIRGASSALYGSDAIGGVINIITKKKDKGEDKLSLSLTQEVGSNLRSYSQGDFSYAGESYSFSLAGSFDYDEGKSEKRETALAGTLSSYLVPYNRLGSLNFDADFHREKGAIGIFGSVTDSLQKLSTNSYETMEYDAVRTAAGVTASKTLGDLGMLDGFLSLKTYDLDTTFTNKALDTEVPTSSNFIDVEAEVRAEYEPTISHAFLFGCNFKRESLEGDSFDDRKNAVTASIFAQDTWNVGASDSLFLVPGLRFDVCPPLDDDTTARYQLTPKLSMRYDPTASTTLRASYGMGYKIPSLKQKYWVFLHNYATEDGNFILYGNPDLKPEVSHGFNISAEQRYGKGLALSASAYFNYISNLIDSEITGNDGTLYIRTYRNIGKAITYGGEASLRYSRGRASGLLGYAYTAAKEYSDEHDAYIDLDSRVPHAITLTASYTVPHIESELSLRANWNAPQLIDYEEESHSPDYLMVSITASKTFHDGTYEFYCRAHNILNNAHFIEGSYNESQEDYYGLYDAPVVTIGGRMKW